MQSFLAKTLAERTVASTEGDTHEVLRSVLVDEFYGASLVILSQMFGVKCICDRPAPNTGLRNVDKWNQRGEHQPAVGVLLLTQGVDGDESTSLWHFLTTFTSRGFSSSTQRSALHS
jgi:hypothetical protein